MNITIYRVVGSDDVSVKITHCGVCYADVAWTRDKLGGFGGSKYPLVPGYVEFSPFLFLSLFPFSCLIIKIFVFFMKVFFFFFFPFLRFLCCWKIDPTRTIARRINQSRTRRNDTLVFTMYRMKEVYRLHWLMCTRIIYATGLTLQITIIPVSYEGTI